MLLVGVAVIETVVPTSPSATWTYTAAGSGTHCQIILRAEVRGVSRILGGSDSV